MVRWKGFTLVELVVVIVILGVLAATAVPGYINFRTQARTNSLTALVSTLNAAVGVVRAGYYANNRISPVTMQNGTSVVVTTTSGVAALGAPTAASIASTIDSSGYTVTAAGGTPSGGTGPVPANTVQFDLSSPVPNCYVRYVNNGTTVSVNSTPGGC